MSVTRADSPGLGTRKMTVTNDDDKYEPFDDVAKESRPAFEDVTESGSAFGCLLSIPLFLLGKLGR
jgi:hypothetical protein